MAAKKKEAIPMAGNSISHCTFTSGINWDATAVGAIQTVADALLENAKAAHALAAVFNSQNITMAPCISIGSPIKI